MNAHVRPATGVEPGRTFSPTRAPAALSCARSKRPSAMSRPGSSTSTTRSIRTRRGLAAGGRAHHHLLQELFGLDGLSARALQKYFYQKHGTTLNGLILEHGVQPDDFLDFVHHIDLTLLEPAPDLGEAIAALPAAS